MGESGAPEHFRRSPIKGEVEHMFLGQYQHNLDNKGRLTIPSRYRDLLEQGAYVTRGFDSNLMVWTVTAFETISKSVNRMSITDPNSRLLRRLIYASGEKVDVDRVGRILIPQFLRQSAGLDGEVVIVGVGDYFEIWSPPTWSQQLADLQDGDANIRRFEAFDLATG
ncbi:MAG: division/cell wall cluster transcriptional repressor MraZ [Anaerolineales bacterium]|nr:MAG: division/cell wall cluster transcriptional repressor MraZ [Anaerolineales bacterium]